MLDFILNLPKHIQIEILNQRCISNIRNRLRAFGFDPDEFIQKMITQKAIIAGGFVLGCMLDEVYTDQEIDIYLLQQAKHNEPFEEYLFSVAGKSGKWHVENGYSPSENIKYTHRFAPYLKTIGLDTDPTQFVIQNFDLSFCRLVFDGYTIRFYPWKETPYPLFDYSMIFRKCGFLVKLPYISSPLNFGDYNHLLNLATVYSSGHAYFYFYLNSRFPKIPVNELLWVGEYGFLTTDERKPECIMFVLYIKACDRIQKYQKRGFVVYGF